MTEIWIVLLGVAFGVMISIPVGPVSLMVINRSVHFGFAAGFTAALGAALADAVLAAISVSGLKAASAFIDDYLALLQLFGGILIVLFGALLTRRRPLQDPGDGPKGYGFTGAAAAFAMSVTNPATVLGFLALFSSVQDVLTDENVWRPGLLMVIGIILGALVWWLSVTSAVSRLRGRFGPTFVARMNTVSGVLMMTLGFVMIFRSVLTTGAEIIGG